MSSPARTTPQAKCSTCKGWVKAGDTKGDIEMRRMGYASCASDTELLHTGRYWHGNARCDKFDAASDLPPETLSLF